VNSRDLCQQAPHRQASARRTINLALQGGGAHGAFTWGVLDRLLEDERIGFEGISGSSGGAINGALLTQGFCAGGAAGARAALDRFFWHRMITGSGPIFTTSIAARPSISTRCYWTPARSPHRF